MIATVCIIANDQSLFKFTYTYRNILVVLILFMLGFACLMTSIVRDDPLYDTSMHTFLTLYQSALGNVDFDINIESDSPFTYLAIVSILIFSGFGYVLIHGFVIARITVGAFNFNYRNVYMYVCIYVELR